MSRPWMPLYVADYLAGTGHLTTIEHGAYMLLIMHYWSKGGLPDDDKRLASIARALPEQWADIRVTISEFFEPGWKHARIDAELEKSAKAYERRASAGKAGGKAKAEKSSNARAMLKLSQPHIKIDREARAREFEAVWAIYPRKVGKESARKKFEAALKVADFQTIMAGAERYAAERAGQDAQYTKHPATWLHGQHWTDEPEPPPKPQSRPPPPERETVGSLSLKQLTNPRKDNDVTDNSERRVEAGKSGRLDTGTGSSQAFTISGDIFGRI